MNRFVIIFLLMSFLLVSCDNRQTKSLLQDVETYIQERPDSALRVLRKVDSLTLNTKSLRARYSLLFAMALDKNYIDTTALSILEPTVAYYERLGSPQDKMLSCYYLGRIYANRKDYPNAVIFYSQALRESSQDGEIATEVYSYSNGYNVQIALAVGTVIWRLAEENNFGQPTRALTGNVDRFYSFDAHGLPTGRALGTVQEFAYDFDPVTGNLDDRFDAVNSAGEIFGYDDLNRLDTVIPDACGDLSQYSVSYRPNGNISEKEGTGVFSYENNARPYQLTKIDLESGVDVPRVPQSISYTCYSRPSRIIENGVSCSFTYDGDGNRAKMLIANGATPILSRYYIGGQYEIDAKADGTVQRLYLGGDAYSAPMVYVKDDSSPWLLYNIGRDYLGSVTCITSVDGALVAEYSYDPWGRLRNPETLELYASGEEPELFLGRGFTGHEHLPYFGLINMNARLYDPFTGRFLSPDPYVQAPDFTQNYNRYSYALNNPLKYGDPNGEFVITATTIIIAGAILASAAYGGYKAYTIADKNGLKGWDKVWRVVGGCAVGAVSCAASIYTGGAVAGALGSLGGFCGGAIAGAAGGAVGGAISGAGMTSLAGGDEEDMLKSASLGALSGAATGALVGGVTNGCIALKNKQTFWTGSPKVPAPSEAIRPPLKDGGPKIESGELPKPKDISGLEYDLAPNPDGGNCTLYRGITGSENSEGPLFMTDDVSYAASYSTNGEVVKVTLPKETIDKMMYNYDLTLNRGMYISSPEYFKGTSYVEYVFSTRVKSGIVSKFVYYKP